MDTEPTPLARLARHPALPGRRRARRNAGFTIIEVAMATFVMLFGISSSILVMQSGFKALDTARKTTLAAQIMQSEMERIRMLNWSQISAMIGEAPEDVDFASIFPQTTEAEKKMFQQIEAAFTATRSTTSLAEYDDETCLITVRVNWIGLDGVTRSRSSSTHYTKDGLYSYYYRIP